VFAAGSLRNTQARCAHPSSVTVLTPLASHATTSLRVIAHDR